MKLSRFSKLDMAENDKTLNQGEGAKGVRLSSDNLIAEKESA
jgi:hypothetical protein